MRTKSIRSVKGSLSQSCMRSKMHSLVNCQIAIHRQSKPQEESTLFRDVSQEFLTSPYIRLQWPHGHHQTTTPGLRLHLLVRAEEWILSLLRRNRRRDAAEFAGHRAQ